VHGVRLVILLQPTDASIRFRSSASHIDRKKITSIATGNNDAATGCGGGRRSAAASRWRRRMQASRTCASAARDVATAARSGPVFGRSDPHRRRDVEL